MQIYLLKYLLIYLLLFREANRFLASQEIPRILLNPKMQYRFYKRLPLVHVLSKISAVLAHHLVIILHFTATPSLRSPYQNPLYTCLLPHTCYMPRPSHSSLFDHPSYIW